MAIKFERIREFDNREQVVSVDALAATGVEHFVAGDRYIAKYDGTWRRWSSNDQIVCGRHVLVGPVPDNGEVYLYHSWDYSRDDMGPSDISKDGFCNLTLKFVYTDTKPRVYAAVLYDEDSVAIFTDERGLLKNMIGVVKLGEEFTISEFTGKPAIMRMEAVRA